jgi:hypothetical protein
LISSAGKERAERWADETGFRFSHLRICDEPPMEEVTVSFRKSIHAVKLRAEAQRIHNAWNDELAARDAKALTSLYDEDATVECPLVRYLLAQKVGFVRDERQSVSSFHSYLSIGQMSDARIGILSSLTDTR